mmetsp:Transcript_70531/g.188243  ORF Transcript_70531/g.188243 Transcript_70531/m.188243 type:complete len:110 (+) Transcript_70531:444-773(+)
MMLVGNKCDASSRKKVVNSFMAQQYADRLGIPFVETSGKDGVNVEQAFTTLATGLKAENAPSNERIEPVKRAKQLLGDQSAGQAVDVRCGCFSMFRNRPALRYSQVEIS